MASLVTQRVKSLPAMQETWIRSLSREDPMEKEMDTLSSIFIWRIPWTREPGRLQSMELQRVRQDWATNYTDSHKHTHKQPLRAAKISSLSPTSGFTTCSINTDWKRRKGKCLPELWVLQKCGTIRYYLWLIQCSCVWSSARAPTCESKIQPTDAVILHPETRILKQSPWIYKWWIFRLEFYFLL